MRKTKKENDRVVARYHLGLLLALFIFIFGVIVSIILGKFDSQQKHSNEKIKVLSELATIRAQLEGVVTSTFNLTQGMVHYISHEHDISNDLFNAMSNRALQENRHIRNIALAPNNIVRWVYPLKGNERAIGLNYLNNKEQRDLVLKTQKLRKPILAGPVKLVQSGVGFINRSPILLGSGPDSLRRFWGVASIVAHVNTILEDGHVTNSQILDVALRGKDGRGAQGGLIWGDSTIFIQNPVIIDVTVPGGKWQLAAIPKSGWSNRSITNSLYFIVGIINTFLITLFLLILIRGNKIVRLINIDLANEISERKKVEKELIKSKEAAESANRMKTAFLANMSHEIRTPMNSILGFSDLMLSGNVEQENNEYYLQIINTSTRQLLTVINDIIDISIIETGQLRIFNRLTKLNALLTNIYQLNLIRAQQNGIELLFFKGLPDIKANILVDDQRLSQILNNLISNAIKFTEKGSIEFGYSLDADLIEFYVKDTGKGIAPEFHEVIFERFRQVEDSQKVNYGGTGLGLAISKSLVELMGGSIWLESELNIGSCFHFTIPYHPVYSDIENAKAKTTLDLHGKTILVAEDDKSSYLLLKGLLKETNVSLIWAENGVDALETFITNPSVDLVLLDIKMPLMNGLELASEIRKTNKEVPIIVQTAYAMSEDKERALSAGCNYYLSKPISHSELIEILRSVFPHSTSI